LVDYNENPPAKIQPGKESKDRSACFIVKANSIEGII
jgi:hypothetical protein